MGKNILVVEDDLDILKSISGFLTKFGYAVNETDNVTPAIKQLQSID